MLNGPMALKISTTFVNNEPQCPPMLHWSFQHKGSHTSIWWTSYDQRLWFWVLF